MLTKSHEAKRKLIAPHPPPPCSSLPALFLLFLFTAHCSLLFRVLRMTQYASPLTGHEIDNQTKIDSGYYVAEKVIFGYNQGRCKDKEHCCACGTQPR